MTWSQLNLITSTRQIAAGEELLWDYGVRPQGTTWLRKDEGSGQQVGRVTFSTDAMCVAAMYTCFSIYYRYSVMLVLTVVSPKRWEPSQLTSTKAVAP